MGEPIVGHIDLVYPSKYVKAADLHGRDVTVKVVKVELEPLVMRGNKKEKKAVMTMADRKTGRVLGKQFVMNKTNLKLVGQALGEKIVGKWPGREITLYPTTDKFGRETVECIRVRARTNAVAEEIPDDMAADPEPVPEFDPEKE